MKKKTFVVIAVLACLLISSQPAVTGDCIEQSYLYDDSGFGMIWNMWVCAVWGDGCLEEVYANCSSCIYYDRYQLCNKIPQIDTQY